MPKFVIISTGSEITGGRSLDTNAGWIANELFLLGWKVSKFITLPDDPKQILHEFRVLLSESKSDEIFAIMTGGLGPTEDDYTLESVLSLTGKSSYSVEKARLRLQKIYESRGKKYEDILPSVLRQTFVPEGSFVLQNSAGIASGFIEKIDNFHLACLPGVPVEMKEMFTRRLTPELKRLFPREDLFIKIKWLWNIGESLFQSEFIEPNRELINTGIEWGVTANRGYIKVIFLSKDQNLLNGILEKLEVYYKDIISDDVFEYVHVELQKQKKTIAVAESCTGGLLGKKITDFPGSSDYFLGGYLTYQNDLKMHLLGVKEKTLLEFGAVSEQTSQEMARGVLKNTDAYFSISITGIAGPSGGSEAKPVGSVWISIFEKGREIKSDYFIFPGNRETIRENAANTALYLIYKHLMANST